MNEFLAFNNNAVTGFWNVVFMHTTITVGNISVTLGQLILAGIMLTAFITVVGVLLNKG